MLRAIPRQVILLIILGFILLGMIIYMVLRPTNRTVRQANLPAVLPSPVIALPNNVPKLPLRNITFTMTNVVLPSTSKVYVLSRGVSRAWANQLAQTFPFTKDISPQFSSDGFDTVTWTSADGTESLTVTLDVGSVLYRNYRAPIKGEPVNPPQSPDEVITMSADFLKGHGLYPLGTTTAPRKLAFYDASTNELHETANFSDATLFEANFTRQINNAAIYQQFANDAQITVWVDKYGKITKVVYQSPEIEEQSSRDYQLVTLAEAKDLLIKGQGTVVNVTPGEPDPRADHELTSATMNKVKVSYFNDSQTALLQPILVFEGQGNYRGLGTQPLTIYLPAIRSEERKN